VQKEARPISLRQLTFFGRSLTENRLISSANYVRNELPTRSLSRRRCISRQADRPKACAPSPRHADIAIRRGYQSAHVPRLRALLQGL